MAKSANKSAKRGRRSGCLMAQCFSFGFVVFLRKKLRLACKLFPASYSTASMHRRAPRLAPLLLYWKRLKIPAKRGLAWEIDPG